MPPSENQHDAPPGPGPDINPVAAAGQSTLWQFAGLGFEFVGVIVAMTVGGYFVDRWLRSSPWFTVAGACVGLVGGTIKFVRTAQAASRRADAEYRRAHPPGSVRPLPPDSDPAEEDADDRWRDT